MSLLLRLAKSLLPQALARRVCAGRDSARADLLERAAHADRRGDHALAERLCRQAIAAAPADAHAWMSLGLALSHQGSDAEAIDALQRAVELAPASVPALYNLGRAFHLAGDHGRAREALSAVLAHAPAFVDAAILLAESRHALGDDDGAIDTLRGALGVTPAHVGALLNLALILNARGRLDEALECLRRAADAAPDNVDALCGLAVVLTDLARTDEALAAARAALAAHPASHAARSIYLFSLLHGEHSTMQQIADEHRRVGALYAAEVPNRTAPFANTRDPARPLRIGYVSGDLRAHVVALFLEPALKARSRDIVSIAYSCVRRPDAVTARLRPLFDTWRDVAALDEASLARLVERDAIDVLVDLSGHTSDSRLGTFARRPAPVQVTWLGYINSTGLTAIDYRLSDEVMEPTGESERHSTETIVRLPNTYWCYRPPLDIGVGVAGGTAREVRFGSFNRNSKISACTLALWARVLRAVPGSRFLATTIPAGSAQARLLAAFEAAGIGRERIELAPRVAQREYFEAFRRVDVCLDPTPYSGATTTCDALWMGVPVVTLLGATPISRSAASLLTAAGARAWIARTAEEYVSVAAALAAEGPRNTAMRTALREQFAGSPVMDAESYARDVEAAYRRMWARWCSA